MTEAASTAILYSQSTFDIANPKSAQMDAMIAAAAAINTSGFTTVILGQWHVWEDGQIFYNNTPYNDVLNGLQVYVQSMLMGGGSVQNVLISFGPGGADFDHIGTNMETVKQHIHGLQAMAGITGIDFDLEGEYSQSQADTLVELCQWANDQGLIVTAAPYDNGEIAFWTGVLRRAGSSPTEGFAWWNLQLYGGADYASWAQAVASDVTNVDQFLIPAFSIAGQSPTDLNSALSSFEQQGFGLDGACLWKYEYAGDAGYPIADYAAVIVEAVGGS